MCNGPRRMWIYIKLRERERGGSSRAIGRWEACEGKEEGDGKEEHAHVA